MKVNEPAINVMDLECMFGRIKQNMKGFEKTIKRMERVHFIILTGMFLKGIELMIKPADLAYINILVELLMKANGKMICRRGMVSKYDRMGKNLRGIIQQGRKMEEVERK